MKVAVLGGGRSSEHDVSLESAKAVREGLQEAGHAVLYVEISKQGTWEHAGNPVHLDPGHGLLDADVVFPVLHGPQGEDGTVQGLLEQLDVAYVQPLLHLPRVATATPFRFRSRFSSSERKRARRYAPAHLFRSVKKILLLELTDLQASEPLGAVHGPKGHEVQVVPVSFTGFSDYSDYLAGFDYVTILHSRLRNRGLCEMGVLGEFTVFVLQHYPICKICV